MSVCKCAQVGEYECTNVCECLSVCVNTSEWLSLWVWCGMCEGCACTCDYYVFMSCVCVLYVCGVCTNGVYNVCIHKCLCIHTWYISKYIVVKCLFSFNQTSARNLNTTWSFNVILTKLKSPKSLFVLTDKPMGRIWQSGTRVGKWNYMSLKVSCEIGPRLTICQEVS